jgi:GTP cyclohydrolase II
MIQLKENQGKKVNIEISKVANLPTKFGNFKIKAYKENDKEHLAIFS